MRCACAFNKQVLDIEDQKEIPEIWEWYVDHWEDGNKARLRDLSALIQ